MTPLRHGAGAGTARPVERRRRPVRVPLRGRFLITEPVIAETERLLRTYRDVDGDHEGLVFLAGRELEDNVTLLCLALAPDCDHGPGHVMATESAIAAVARAARARDLGVLAQVHSHPAAWTRHSDGDDHMVLMPFEGMLSIVAPHYGRPTMLPLRSLGVHQHQDGLWRLVKEHAIAQGIVTIPAGLDLR